MGRVTTKFAVIQQKHFRIQGLRNTGKALLRKMITQVWDISWTMWEHRNCILHKTMTPRKQAHLENLRQKVREQFADGTHGMAMKDRHYLDPTKKEWALEQDLEDTSIWLKSVRISRGLHTRTKSQATPLGVVRQQQIMHAWLHQQELPPINEDQSVRSTSTSDDTEAPSREVSNDSATAEIAAGRPRSVSSTASSKFDKEEIDQISISDSSSSPSTAGYSIATTSTTSGPHKETQELEPTMPEFITTSDDSHSLAYSFSEAESDSDSSYAASDE